MLSRRILGYEASIYQQWTRMILRACFQKTYRWRFGRFIFRRHLRAWCCWTQSTQTCRAQEGGCDQVNGDVRDWTNEITYCAHSLCEKKAKCRYVKHMNEWTGRVTAWCKMCPQGCVNVLQKMGWVCGVVASTT